MWEVGGISGLADKLPDGYMHIFRSSSDRKFPWTGLVFGYPIIAFWYWCTDQVIVQRVLAAKSVTTARRGKLLTMVLYSNKTTTMLRYCLSRIFKVITVILSGDSWHDSQSPLSR